MVNNITVKNKYTKIIINNEDYIIKKNNRGRLILIKWEDKTSKEFVEYLKWAQEQLKELDDS